MSLMDLTAAVNEEASRVERLLRETRSGKMLYWRCSKCGPRNALPFAIGW
jgi:hypothetical protein